MHTQTANVALVVLLSLIGLHAADVSISGVVLDKSSGTGIAAAQLYLKKNPLIETVSNSSGAFRLSGYTQPVLHRTPRAKTAAPRIVGNHLVFYTRVPLADAHIELYNSQGKRLSARRLAGLAPGEHTIALIDQAVPSGLCIVRLRSGEHLYTLNSPLLRNCVAAARHRGRSLGLAKPRVVSAAIDSIIVVVPGYSGTAHPIANYVTESIVIELSRIDTAADTNGTPCPFECPAASEITLLCPNGGETYSVGDIVQVKWCYGSGFTDAGVVIKASTDGGRIWSDPMGAGQIDKPNNTFRWVVSEKEVGTEILLQVEGYNDNTLFDRTDSSYTVLPNLMLTDQQEFALGMAIETLIESDSSAYPLYVNAAGAKQDLVDYIDSLGQLIVRSQTDRDGVRFGFRIIANDTTINAFAVPGGLVYIYTGLLLNCRDEAEIAAALAHEVAHVAKRHGVKTLLKGYGYDFLFDILEGDTLKLRALMDARTAPAFLMYSRAEEYLADSCAVEYLISAGINPNGIKTFLELVDAEQGSSTELLSTHPPTLDRLERVTDQVDRKPSSIAELPTPAKKIDP